MATATQSDAKKAPTALTHSLAARFADYVLNTPYDAIAPEAIAEAKRRLMDSLGCAMGAMNSKPATVARTLALTAGMTAPNHGATVIGTPHRSTPDWAAFANGVLFRYLDFNDTYLSKEPAHPSDNIAAILAVAQVVNAPWREVWRAIVIAYEIQCRLCDAYSIRAQGWDHVTYGSFSAVLGCGALLGLSREQLIHAQGIAATGHNAMRQTRVGELSHWKGCAFANTSRNAVFAALLARGGMTGPAPIFEGEMGFFKQVAHSDFEVPTMAGEPGNTDGWMILKTYVKHYPAEYHAQSAIEAALVLREKLYGELNSTWQDIQSVHIDSFDAAIEIIASFAEHWRPENRETADHSMPYMVAAALVDGDVTLETFTHERIHDPVLIEFLQTVTAARHPEMNAGYPDGIPNRLTLTLKNGQTLSHEIKYPLGHAKNLMTDADIQAKFTPLAARVMDAPAIAAVVSAMQSLDDAAPVDALLGLFSAVAKV